MALIFNPGLRINFANLFDRHFYMRKKVQAHLGLCQKYHWLMVTQWIHQLKHDRMCTRCYSTLHEPLATFGLYGFVKKKMLVRNNKRTGVFHLCSHHTLTHTGSLETIQGQPPWKVLFFGSDHFSLETLQLLTKDSLNHEQRVVESIEVVCKQGKSPVRSYAEECNLHVHSWPISTMKNKYDVGVVVSFGKLIPGRIIRMFPYGILNVHASLLPRWRGASPIIHTILSGDKVTGISIMEIRPKNFDIGPLLVQKEYPISSRLTSFQLHNFLSKESAELLLQTLKNLLTLEKLEREQDPKEVTYAHKLMPSMAYINWAEQNSVEIDRQYRAIHELLPLRSKWGEVSIKLCDMVDPEELQVYGIADLLSRLFQNRTPIPGTSCFDKKLQCVLVKCQDGWVGFRKIIIRKPLSAQAFYNGYLSKTENKTIIFSSIPNHINKDIYREKVISKAC